MYVVVMNVLIISSIVFFALIFLVLFIVFISDTDALSIQRRIGKSKYMHYNKMFAFLIGPILALAQLIFALTFVAIIVLYITQSFLANNNLILQMLSNRYSIIPIILTAFLLFWLRGFAPFTYGMLEIIVALSVINIAIASSAVDLFGKLISLSGGVYIFVRGLDNLEKGMPNRFKLKWSRLFPKSQLRQKVQNPLSPNDP